MSPAQKWNYSPLDVISIKLCTSIIFPKLSSSLILSMWSKEFLTSLSIPSKFSQLLFCLIFATSSIVTPTTLLNFGNALAVSSGIFITRSIKKLKCSNHYLSTHAKIQDFSKKCESYDILNIWKMMFQASNLKGNQFLDLVDDDNNIIEPTYVKGGSWLKMFSHLNSLCTRTTRTTTNHAPIGEFRLRFFPREEFKCPCN